MSYRIAVCVSGRGSNLRTLLEVLDGTPQAMVALVMSDRPQAGALALAKERRIATHVLAAYQDADEWLRPLTTQRIDLIVLAGFLKLVPAQVIAAYPDRIINIHPALLPKYGGRGMYGDRVHRAVLEAGDSESGATVHLVTAEYDRGSILGQIRVPVNPDDTPDSLAARVLEAEHRLLPAAVLAAAAAGHPVPFTLSNENLKVNPSKCPAL